MHTAGSGRDRDISAIVHEHARLRPSNAAHHLPHEIHERRVRQVPFANVNAGHAGAGGPDRTREQFVLAEIETPAICDEVADHEASRRLARLAITDPNSARPASAVTTPTPVTPPRAYGLLSKASMTGRDSANRLRSQKLDHGATIRMNPASRK